MGDGKSKHSTINARSNSRARVLNNVSGGPKSPKTISKLNPLKRPAGATSTIRKQAAYAGLDEREKRAKQGIEKARLQRWKDKFDEEFDSKPAIRKSSVSVTKGKLKQAFLESKRR